MVARHIQELSIEVNRKSNVDRKLVDSSRETRDAREAERVSKSELMYTNCRDIRDEADIIQGKISEFEVLLLAFAD